MIKPIERMGRSTNERSNAMMHTTNIITEITSLII